MCLSETWCCWCQRHEKEARKVLYESAGVLDRWPKTKLLFKFSLNTQAQILHSKHSPKTLSITLPQVKHPRLIFQGSQLSALRCEGKTFFMLNYVDISQILYDYRYAVFSQRYLVLYPEEKFIFLRANFWKSFFLLQQNPSCLQQFYLPKECKKVK